VCSHIDLQRAVRLRQHESLSKEIVQLYADKCDRQTGLQNPPLF
jgi:hypothetical protein